MASYQIFLSSIERHELLVIIQFPCCTEISQLIDGAAISSNELHDISRFQVSVNEIVITEMLHPLSYTVNKEVSRHHAISKFDAFTQNIHMGIRIIKP